MGEHAAAARHVDALLALSDEQTFPFWRGFGQGMRAALLARQGAVDQAEVELADALDILDRLSVGWFRPFIHCSLARALIEARAPKAAERHLCLARGVIERTEERWIEPELARVDVTVAAARDVRWSSR